MKPTVPKDSRAVPAKPGSRLDALPSQEDDEIAVISALELESTVGSDIADDSRWAPAPQQPQPISEPSADHEAAKTIDNDIDRRHTRRWPVFAAGTLFGAALVAAAALWVDTNHGTNPRAVVLGSLSDFPDNSITFLEIDNAYLDHLRLEGPEERQPEVPRLVEDARLYVTNQADTIHVFLARSPYLGCRLIADARTVRDFAGSYDADPDEAVLADPCHGGVFAADGAHLGGQGGRGLDWFPVSYEPDGNIAIDITDLRPGLESLID